MKALKIILVLIVLLFGGAAGAVYFGPNYLDWNQYKPQIESFLKSSTGYTISLKGDLSIKTMPEATIDVGGITVKAHNGTEPLLDTGAVSAQIGLKSLLWMHLNIKRLSVENPTVVLSRDAEGIANWEPKTKRSRGGRTPTDLGPVKALGDVVLSNVSLSYSDAATGMAHKLEDVQISADGHQLSQLGYNIGGQFNGEAFSAKGRLSVTLLQEIPFSLEFLLADMSLKMSGVVIEPLENIATNISSFEFKDPKPFDTLQRIGLLTTVPDVVFEGVELKTKAQIEPKRVQMTETFLVANGTRFVGDVSYEEVGKQNAIRSNLKVSSLDVDKFFPPKEAAKKKMGPPWDDKLIDTSFFRRNNIRLDLQVDELIGVLPPTMKNVEFKINGDNGVVLFDTLAFSIDKGEFRGNGRLDAGSPSRYQFRGKYDNLPLEKFIASGKANYFELPITGDMEFLFSGDTTQEIVENLNGKMGFTADAGLIKGVNLADPAIAITNFLSGKKVLDREEKLANAKATFDISNGVIRNNDAEFEAINMLFKGKGKVDLVKWTIGYRVDPITKGDSLANIVLGVRVQGSLDNPLAVPIMDNKSTGALIGTAVGGPVGAGVGALIGSMLDNNAKPKDETPKPGQSGTVDLPFDFSDVNNLEENVRRFLEQQKK